MPKSLLINTSHLDKENIEAFITDSHVALFIVRSTNLSEDGGDFSLAGHFWSSEAVTKQEVFNTIQLATQENANVLDTLGLKNAPQLILQEYIQHTIGGVIFSPWGFFTDYSYVEYSELGVKSVVEGQDAQSTVLSTDSEQAHPLALPDTLSYLSSDLYSLCQQLRDVFDFPVDCEWAYDEIQQCILVLQVRPQTHLLGPVLATAKPEESTIPNDQPWQFTALSESLGRLSPLSFSLLEQLYNDVTPMLQSLGCKAEAINFMHYAPDGTVLVDPNAEQQFFKMTLFGGFKRGLKQAELQTNAHQVMSEHQTSSDFSYNTLLTLFKYWLAANVMSSGAGRNQVTDEKAAAHAYELSWPTTLPHPIKPDDNAWPSLNSWGRQLFLYELNKLKQMLITETKKQPHLAFCKWSEYLDGNYDKAQQRQHSQAPKALYDYALFGSNDNGIQALSSTTAVTGSLFIISKPTQFKTQIPDGSILVAPYFDNRWVGKISVLKGIIVNRGSRLSHSAIVAREHGVPYYVMPELGIDTLSSDQQIKLEAGNIR